MLDFLKMKIKIIISFGLISFVLLLFYFGLKNENKYETFDLVGKKLSSFELKSLDEKNVLNSKTLEKNNFTLINFWATWCAPCRKEHEYLMLLNKKTGLKILGVNFKDKKENALEFLQTLGNPYYLLAIDRDGRSSVNFGIYGIPESILVDKELTIIKKFNGPINSDNYQEIVKIVNNL